MELFTLVGKGVSITFKDSAKYSCLPAQGICVQDDHDIIGIRCIYKKDVTFIAKEIIEIMRVDE